jgi:hypothetical protein
MDQSRLPMNAVPKPARRIKLEFLYLDLTSCGRCQGTEQTLDEALRAAQDALDALNVTVDLRKLHVANSDVARDVGLVASPTIRIDGRDIQPEVLQSPCTDCGALCGCDGGCVSCRKWRWRGAEYAAAPAGLIVEALMAAAIASAPTAVPTDGRAGGLPENIERFFTGREAQKNPCCQAGEGEGCVP